MVILRVLLCVIALSVGSLAEDTSTKIAAINLRQAILDAKDAQGEFADAIAKFQSVDQQLAAMNRQLDETQAQLDSNANVLSDKSVAEFKNRIEGKRKAAEDYRAANRRELAARQLELADRTSARLIKIIQEYAAQQGFSSVLDSTHVENGKEASVIWTAANNPSEPNKRPVQWPIASQDITSAIEEFYEKQYANSSLLQSGATPSSPVSAAPTHP